MQGTRGLADSPNKARQFSRNRCAGLHRDFAALDIATVPRTESLLRFPGNVLD